MNNFFLISLLLLPIYCFAQNGFIDPSHRINEKLVVVKGISSTKKTFVISKGKKEGILPGQISMFSTDNISLLARAVTVNRDYSQWVVLEKEAKVPFTQDQFVTLSKSVERIWTELPILQMQEKYRQKQLSKLRKKGDRFISAKVNIIRGIKESTSDVTTESGTRQGISFEGIYSFNYTPNFEVGLGVRYDNEVLNKEEVGLDITTTRVYGIAEALYHLEKFKGTDFHLYGGVQLGLGQSSTVVNEETKSGPAFILPAVKVGANLQFTKNYSIIFEGTIENVSATEEFESGDSQETSSTQAKIAVGLKF